MAKWRNPHPARFHATRGPSLLTKPVDHQLLTAAVPHAMNIASTHFR